MLVNETLLAGQLLIRSSDAKSIQIGDRRLELPVSLSPRAILPASLPKSFADFELESLSSLLDPQTEILIIGTGERFIPASPALVQAAKARRIGLELAPTAAACRIFNILVGERRAVLGVLFE